MKKLVIYSALAISVIFVLCLALVALAQQAVVNQPVGTTSIQNEDLPTENEWVKVRIDEGMFTLYAALNASGYDQENFDLPYHPVRQLVRERLAGRHFSGQERLRTEMKTIQTYNFVVWVLHYGPPPEFARVKNGWSDPKIPAFLFFGLDSQLRDFYNEMDIASLWKEVRPQYEQEAASYQRAAGQAVQSALDYTRMKDVPLKRVVIIPNLLAPNWNGFGPTVGDTAYVVVGPTEGKPDVHLVQHEALHSIAGPLVEANIGVIDEEHRSVLYDDLRKRVPSGYGSWESIVEEQVVRAINCRLASENCEQFLRNDEAEGFLLERTIINSLADFEQSNLTLAQYVPEIFGSINAIELPLKQP